MNSNINIVLDSICATFLFLLLSGVPGVVSVNG
jgi:hypothetical protein